METYIFLSKGKELFDKAIDKCWFENENYSRLQIKEGQWTLPIEILAQVAEDGTLPGLFLTPKIVMKVVEKLIAERYIKREE